MQTELAQASAKESEAVSSAHRLSELHTKEVEKLRAEIEKERVSAQETKDALGRRIADLKTAL
jgi:hypothetical protein